MGANNGNGRTNEPKGEIKKVSFNMSSTAYTEMQELIKKHNKSMIDLIRMGLSLARLMLEEKDKGHKLIVCTQDGTPIKELVLPAEE